jgi:hypothetical protein
MAYGIWHATLHRHHDGDGASSIWHVAICYLLDAIRNGPYYNRKLPRRIKTPHLDLRPHMPRLNTQEASYCVLHGGACVQKDQTCTSKCALSQVPADVLQHPVHSAPCALFPVPVHSSSFPVQSLNPVLCCGVQWEVFKMFYVDETAM